MSLSKLTFAIGALAFVGVVSAASLDIDQPTWVGQTQLNPGHYKIELQGDKAVIKNSKQSVEVPVTVEKGKQKFYDTSVEASGSKIQTIHLGGSSTTITIKPSTSAPTAVGNGVGNGIGL